ncbi:hypothetical protein B0H65DRAFT_534615 [Neurospora tetraspora]|uniref:Uncharacterized protein n=1 Tax=Neurospora tetraspora TaxID=94610 RepID=A0AAE0J150_9PEZI|nr:hypothetical protein B0H65DRAFT_534615 [Neurospora tetraspora]
MGDGNHQSAHSDHQGNQQGSQVHQQSPGQHDIPHRENVNNLVPVPMNFPQNHHQQNSGQHCNPSAQTVANPSRQTLTNPPINFPQHLHPDPGFDDMYADGLLDDMPDHFDPLPGHNPLFGNSLFDDNSLYVPGHLVGQPQHYQQGEQYLANQHLYQDMMSYNGALYQQQPHPFGAQQFQEPAIPQNFPIPNGSVYGAQHPIMDQQLQGQVHVPIQHQAAFQQQAPI